MARWTTKGIPPQHGRSVIVTGTGGLGFEDALALSRAGAEVIIAGRNPGKGAQAVALIRRSEPAANVRYEQLDLASLESVAAFADCIRSQRDSLDVLIPPTRQETADGFELQLGTNYLGHFARTAGLMPLLRNGRDARVVSRSSVAAGDGKINFDDLQAKRSYQAMPVYSQSRLACLMFAFELQRRSVAAGWGVASIASHPGISRTNLLHNAPGRLSGPGIARSLLWFLFQPVWQGALPTLFAATSPDAEGGGYVGPDGAAEIRGYPTTAKAPQQALDRAVATRLWEVSEELTRTRFA